MSVSNSPFRVISAPPADSVITAQQATRVVLEFDCEASAAIGDLVHQDTIIENKVIVCADNTTTEPTIGVIISKPTSATCEVLVLGLQNGYSGLTIGDKAFLDIDGTITTTKPPTGYVQTLGTVVASDTIFFLPNTTRVLQA